MYSVSGLAVSVLCVETGDRPDVITFPLPRMQAQPPSGAILVMPLYGEPEEGHSPTLYFMWNILDPKCLGLEGLQTLEFWDFEIFAWIVLIEHP